jgi:gold/copper resistance efflux system membrane fusion protein
MGSVPAFGAKNAAVPLTPRKLESPMSGKHVVARLVAAALFILGWLFFVPRGGGVREAAASGPAAVPAPEVQAAEVVTRELPDTAEFTGTLAAVHNVELRPRVGGYIAAVRFAEGGLVEKGQVLFALDARPFEAALEQAQAQLRQAQERRALAVRRAERGERLRAEGIMSQADFDTLAAERADSSAAVEAARAAARTARINLEDTRVRAPISGRAGQALVTEGNLVSGGSAGATLLTTIVSVDPLHVTFDVDEPTYLRVATAEARQADGRVAGVPVHVALAGDEGFTREARLDFLGNRVDPTSGTARARALLSNPDGRLAPGLFARVRLQTGAARPTVLVSDVAVGTDQQGRYVLVVKPDQSVEQRRVELGAGVDGLRVVRRGLAAGERVVLKGFARPGMTVNPKPVAMASATAGGQ